MTENETVAHCEAILFAVNKILKLKKEKVIRAFEPSGKWRKERILPPEKLIRIRAALLTLPPELLEVIDFEAKNRVMIAAKQAEITGNPPRNPWEL